MTAREPAELAAELDAVAADTDFSGVASISVGERVLHERAYGLADRAHRVANAVDTQFNLASGTKSYTALTVVSLIDEGVLSRSTTARSVLGTDLPLVDPGVTVDHLLTHRSGVGDYLDEETLEDDDDYVLRVPVHVLSDTEGYVAALAGFPTKFAPGTRFAYSNSGYVLLALIAERVTGTPFADLVRTRVFEPAGMPDSEFLRLDRLPGRAAIGYLDDGRSNVLHIGVRGSGDGGAFSTAADVRRFWLALFDGRIVSRQRAAETVAAQPGRLASGVRPATGFWRAPAGPTVIMNGGDVGVSFDSEHDPGTGRTVTVLSNTGGGAPAVSRRLSELIFG